MYVECDGCGQLATASGERAEYYRPCPVCEERTRWTPAFTDSDRGVSF